MAFIDSEGRVFGRFNIVDTIVVLTLIAGIALFGAKRVGFLNLGKPSEKPVTVRFLTKPITPATVKNITKKSRIFIMADMDAKPLGTVIDLETKPAEERMVDIRTGKVRYLPDPRRQQVLLTVKGKGNAETFDTVGGNALLVGNEGVILKTEHATFGAEVVSVKFGD